MVPRRTVVSTDQLVDAHRVLVRGPRTNTTRLIVTRFCCYIHLSLSQRRNFAYLMRLVKVDQEIGARSRYTALITGTHMLER